MQAKIFIGIILVGSGTMLGLLILSSWQFHQRLGELENFTKANEERVGAIEIWLNQNFTPRSQPEKNK